MASRADNFSKYTGLRKSFPFFSYDGFEYRWTPDGLAIRFDFNLSGRYRFKPLTIIPFNKDLFKPPEKMAGQILDSLVFHIGMIELISYWKAACPPRLIIRPARLTAGQSAFFRKVYYHGLGEFFWMNAIPADEQGFMEIVSEGIQPIQPFDPYPLDGALVPVGGGKDSAVAMSLAGQAGANWVPFTVNPRRSVLNVIKASGKQESETVVFYRQLDPQLLRLNDEGYLNGHTPFSALLAFYSLLAAYLTGRNEIMLANESSASDPTVPGTDINHQYSKSLGFERDFRDYCSNNISPAFNYFSLLRPLSELQIARLFAGLPEVHGLFRSCNAGSKTDSWCGKCPKCLFTFIILSPFLPPDRLEAIYGRNLLNDRELLPVYRQLAGLDETKPFDCIGTPDEVSAAMDKAQEHYAGRRVPFLLQYHLRTRIKPQGMFDRILRQLDPVHFVPDHYLNRIIKLFE